MTKTLFDILLLRKGPEAIPGVPIVLFATFALWLLAGFALVGVLADFLLSDLIIGLFTGILALTGYAAILSFFGFRQRTISTLSAIMGCGALAVGGFIAIFTVLRPLVGPDQAYLAGFPLLLWTIPVEGFIVARAINRPWFFGCMIALTLFFVQLFFDQALTSPATVA